ncbi:MAG: hypothetical protein R3F17_03160 [Planctomycetota bacterium]
MTLWGSWLEDEQALVWMEAPAHLMIGLPGPGRAIAIEEGRRVVEFDFLTGQRRVIFPAKEMQ